MDALNEAIALAASTATFAASPGVVDNVFEYAKWVPPANTFDPLDPATRFKTTAPVLVQPTFDMPGFKGHLTAFINKSTSPTCPAGATEPVAGTCQLWDAGQKLLDRLTRTAAGAACAAGSTDCMVPGTASTRSRSSWARQPWPRWPPPPTSASADGSSRPRRTA